MAQVLPFRAVRPDKKVAAEVAALPYDVYSREEAREAVAGHPLSFLNIDRPETQFPENQDMYAPEVYEKARDMIEAELADHTFLTENKSCYYVYELTMNGRSQTGIAALSSIDDYINGVCKKHENTVEEKEQDRIRHVDTCSAQTGPIFLCYRDSDTINQIVKAAKTQEPEYDFTCDDDVRHRMWVVSDDSQIDALKAAFTEVPATYIADGHHRAASAVKVGLKRRAAKPDYDGTEEFNYFLSVLFPDSELEIMDYNRVVKDLNGMKPEDFMTRLEEIFDVYHIAKAEKPQTKGEMTLYIDGIWFLLRTKPEILAPRLSDPVKSLDVSLLQDLVLTPMLGIQDPRTDKRIAFVGGIRGLGELEKKVSQFTYQNAMNGTLEAKGPALAFAMYPTAITELLNVADHGLLMPPKSTWFEPKLRSGLLIHKI